MENDKDGLEAPKFFVVTLTISMIVFFLGLLFFMFLLISKLDGNLKSVSYVILISAAVLFAISIIGICSFMIRKRKQIHEHNNKE